MGQTQEEREIEKRERGEEGGTGKKEIRRKKAANQLRK